MTAVRTQVRRGDDVISVIDFGGAGPTVVLLHGLAGSAHEFVPTAEALKDRFRVLAVDQRGHGFSSRRPDDLTRSAFVDDLIAVIEELAPHTPVTVVGQSMGSHTAFLTAAERPDLIARLIMLEGHPAGGDGPDEAVRIGEYFASWPDAFDSAESARDFLGESALTMAWIEDFEPTAEGLRPRFDADVLRRIMDDVCVPRWSEWEALRVPTVAVFGEQGMFTDVQKDEMIRRRPSTLRFDLRGAGHDAHLDSREQWLAVLQAGLAAEFGPTGP